LPTPAKLRAAVHDARSREVLRSPLRDAKCKCSSPGLKRSTARVVERRGTLANLGIRIIHAACADTADPRYYQDALYITDIGSSPCHDPNADPVQMLHANQHTSPTGLSSSTCNAHLCFEWYRRARPHHGTPHHTTLHHVTPAPPRSSTPSFTDHPPQFLSPNPTSIPGLQPRHPTSGFQTPASSLQRPSSSLQLKRQRRSLTSSAEPASPLPRLWTSDQAAEQRPQRPDAPLLPLPTRVSGQPHRARCDVVVRAHGPLGDHFGRLCARRDGGGEEGTGEEGIGEEGTGEKGQAKKGRD
jgi:hypothetical protein